MSFWDEPSEQEAHHGEIEKGFTMPNEQLVLAAQPAGIEQPRKGSLHHPAPRSHQKPALLLGHWHNCKSDLSFLPDPAHCPGFVATIHPDMAHPFGCLATHHHLACACAVGDVGCRDVDGYHQAIGINQHMTLATPNVLGGIVAPFTLLCGLDCPGLLRSDKASSSS